MEVPEKYNWIVKDLEVEVLSAEEVSKSHVALNALAVNPNWRRYLGRRGIVIKASHGSVRSAGYPDGLMWYSRLNFPDLGNWEIYNDILREPMASIQDLASWIRKERHGGS